MDSALEVLLLYGSKSSLNCFGPLPSDCRKFSLKRFWRVQSSSSRLKSPPTSVALDNRAGAGAAACDQDGPHLSNCSLGSKMLLIGPGHCQEMVLDSQASLLWARVAGAPPTGQRCCRPGTQMRALREQRPPLVISACHTPSQLLPFGYFSSCPSKELLDVSCCPALPRDGSR